ncbi:carbonic anhydrase [Saccharopolyspora dendranthemae]|uniref:Carbonic anhydrase n=1 Tax=Saccharopolyspora dendranthemae TaxID=1181886 RepID=A0A561V9X1_9PSEU|nr:carbonic anhydrase [Saccharopolyspora dendranthemae]TWG08421.1 carbonic anhydrase [Saccharopolyspora dendranthemae]
MSFDNFVRHARRHSHLLSADQRKQLAQGQSPSALFIGCSDSRVTPSHITGAESGTLFELRTAGNVVPKYAPDSGSSEMGTIEYAVLQLGIPDIIVCGHSHCGAVTALTIAGRGLDELPALCTWLGTDAQAATEPEDSAVRTESKRHLRAQLDTLREYPFIRDRIESGRLRLHGWFYEIDTGLVYVAPQSAEEQDFLPL